MDFPPTFSNQRYFPQIRGFGKRKLIPPEQDSACRTLFKGSVAWAWG